jgi:hypothetical protein
MLHIAFIVEAETNSLMNRLGKERIGLIAEIVNP